MWLAKHISVGEIVRHLEKIHKIVVEIHRIRGELEREKEKCTPMYRDAMKLIENMFILRMDEPRVYFNF